MRLVRVTGDEVVPLPAIARFSHIDMTDAQQRLDDELTFALEDAVTERFKLMRCGLISLFHYANQVFDAEDGHLLLRGSNGSGKSTAMELIVPLLFDGNLSASNLSTSDGQRSIAYHLLLDGLYPRRLGYSWIQFAQPAMAPTWVTLALGVKMSQDTRHDPWFLVWDTPVMIDPHVMLERDETAPLRGARTRRSCPTSSSSTRPRSTGRASTGCCSGSPSGATWRCSS